MRIEAYFQQIRNLVDACPVVQSSSLTYDKRSTHEGFIRGEIYLLDASVPHLREFVDVEITVERLLYAITTWTLASNYGFATTTQDIITRRTESHGWLIIRIRHHCSNTPPLLYY